MINERMPFIFTSHARQRYQQRILNDSTGKHIANLDSLIAKDIYRAKENMSYLSIPRYVLFLYEKYGAIDGLRVFESEQVTYITKRDKGEGFRRVLTCWKREPDNIYFNKFFKTVLSNQEIYTRIAALKGRKKR